MKKKFSKELNFAICLSNKDYPASLEVGKIYKIIKDNVATKHGYIRIIDESGEDYAYSTERFFPIALPKSIADTLISNRGRMVA